MHSSDRYEVNEASTRKPNTQGDEFFNNGGYGIGQGPPLGAAAYVLNCRSNLLMCGRRLKNSIYYSYSKW